MSSCIQEAFLLKDLSSSLSLYLSFCVSLSSSWSPPDEPWCSPRSDDVWYVSGSAQIAEMWLFIDDRLTGWRRRRRREKATVRSAPDGSDNECVALYGILTHWDGVTVQLLFPPQSTIISRVETSHLPQKRMGISQKMIIIIRKLVISEFN